MDIDEDLRKRIIGVCSPDLDGWALKSVDTRLSPTGDLVDGDQVLNYKRGVTIGTAVGWRLFATGGIAAISAMLIDARLEGGDFGRLYLVFFAALSTIVWFILKKIKSLNRRIRIDRKGITLGEVEHAWQQVYGTYIYNPVFSADGRTSSTSFVVVVDKDGSIEKKEITFLAISMYELATVIEYFKAESDK